MPWLPEALASPASICLSAAFPQLDCSSHLAPPQDRQVSTGRSMRMAPGPSGRGTPREGRRPLRVPRISPSAGARHVRVESLSGGTLGQGRIVPRVSSEAAEVVARSRQGGGPATSRPQPGLSPFPGLDLVLRHHQHWPSSATPPTHTHAPRRVWVRFRHQPEHGKASTPDGVPLLCLLNRVL